MKNNVLKFPETIDQAFKRIDKKYDSMIQKNIMEMKRLNWFAGGFLSGALISMSVGLICYYFFEIK